jgi:methylmalonyl-CoA mutase N-terminal domain/subunit
VQELAFTLSNAIEYTRRALSAGLAIDQFAPRLSFFFASHNDLFEEVAKFRAARRLYARIMRDKFGASDASARLRFHTQTGGVTLQAQQPMNNIPRVTVQALAAVLGGTQSLHTNGYDEALSLPSQQAATLALRTQQVLAYESGVTQAVDPLGGSYYVEALTDEVERRAAELIEHVESLGGAERAIAAGYFQEEIGRSAYDQQRNVESGETVIVGVNRFVEDEPTPILPSPDYSALEREQVERVRAARASREGGAAEDALKELRAGAAGREALMPLIIRAVKARATVGEISDALEGEWGRYGG